MDDEQLGEVADRKPARSASGLAQFAALCGSAALALTGWSLARLVRHGEHLASHERALDDISGALDRIEDKVDRIVERSDR